MAGGLGRNKVGKASCMFCTELARKNVTSGTVFVVISGESRGGSMGPTYFDL